MTNYRSSNHSKCGMPVAGGVVFIRRPGIWKLGGIAFSSARRHLANRRVNSGVGRSNEVRVEPETNRHRVCGLVRDRESYGHRCRREGERLLGSI